MNLLVYGPGTNLNSYVRTEVTGGPEKRKTVGEGEG